jgi:hypothetical protein
MQIILKEKEDGTKWLFDTRSGKFFEGGCVKNANTSMLDVANAVARKPFRNIVEIADFPVYGENGNLEWMIACRYLKMNPDIRDKVLESKENLKERVDRKTQRRGKRGRKPKEDKPEKPKALAPDGTPRKRGRPRKNPV